MDNHTLEITEDLVDEYGTLTDEAIVAHFHKRQREWEKATQPHFERLRSRGFHPINRETRITAVRPVRSGELCEVSTHVAKSERSLIYFHTLTVNHDKVLEVRVSSIFADEDGGSQLIDRL